MNRHQTKPMTRKSTLDPRSSESPGSQSTWPRKPPPSQKIWSLDKANVLATSHLWRKTVTSVLDKEFPPVPYEHQLIDSAAMICVKSPTKLNGVIVTSNLFGDISPTRPPSSRAPSASSPARAWPASPTGRVSVWASTSPSTAARRI